MAETPMAYPVDPAGRGMYRLGGISALLLGTVYVATVAVYIPAGTPPTGGEAWLQYLPERTTVWWTIVALTVIADLLFVPIALSLYLALKGINRSVMLLGTALVGLFVVLDLAVTTPSIAALINLSGGYASATTDAERASYVAAANYPSAVLASPLAHLYSVVVPALGILLIGLVMRKGIFHWSGAYVGVAVGILGIISVASLFIVALDPIVIVVSVLTTIWAFLVGYRLFRLGSNRGASGRAGT